MSVSARRRAARSRGNQIVSGCRRHARWLDVEASRTVVDVSERVGGSYRCISRPAERCECGRDVKGRFADGCRLGGAEESGGSLVCERASECANRAEDLPTRRARV